MKSEISSLTPFHVAPIWYYRKDTDVAPYSNLISWNYSLCNVEIMLVPANLILQTRRPQEAPQCCLLRKNTHK